MTIGDMNGDSDLDLVAANANADTVSVLLGDDNGTFLSATHFPIAPGDFPTSVTTGDVDGDTFRDVVTANEISNNVTVLMGNGDGTFDPAVPYPTNGLSPQSVAIADLDSDTDLDLAVANIATDNVSVLLNDGNGIFAPAAPPLYPTGVGPNEVVIGDINGDPSPDLVTANLSSGSVTVLLGNGDGTFQPPQTHVNFGNVGAVAIGEFDGDGVSDLAITVNNNLAVVVLLGNGDGTFTPGQQKDVGTGPSSVAIGDLDADSIVDIIVTNEAGDDTVSVLTGNGDGTFDDQVVVPTGGASPTSVRLAHLDDDGRLDVVTANANSNTVSVLLNPSEFTTGPTATISGTVRQGQTLMADEGTPVPTQDSFTYEWFADGATIGGATAKTFVPTSAQVGKKITVTVTAIKAGLNDASDTSPETVPVIGIFAPGPKASIDGLARVGSTLYARPGSPSPTPTSFVYRWYADGKLVGTARTLKLALAHHGKRIQVRIYAVKPGFLTASNLSPATAKISNLQAKTISMELNDYTVKRGQRIYAEIELLASGEPWSIVLDGKKLASGVANTKGIAVTGLTIPTNATTGKRILRAYGKFTDRTDPDRITVR